MLASTEKYFIMPRVVNNVLLTGSVIFCVCHFWKTL